MIEQYPGSLHNHTDYSNIKFRDAISTTEGLIDKAIELGHSVVAFTEHDCICNAVKIEKYYNKIKKEHPDFKVIRGNEIYLCRDELAADNFVSGTDKFYHFVLLARDAVGYKQIRELSTKAWSHSFVFNNQRRIPTYYSDLEEIIGANPGHVIGSTACLGSAIGTQLLRYRIEENSDLYCQILNWCQYLRSIFGEENFFLELQPSAQFEQEYVNKQLLIISKKLNIPYIITTDTHYLNKEDRPIHEAYLKSQDAEREVGDFYRTTYMMDTQEIEGYLSYMSQEELSTAYENIQFIADRCEDFSIFKPLRIPELKWKIPYLSIIQPIWYVRIPMLKTFAYSNYQGDNILAKAIIERIETDETLQNKETYDEVDLELHYVWESSKVNNAHWSAYFLNLQNIIDLCWEAGSIVGPGRGSGVGFLILYILGITQINPLRETTKTYPWRFLNPSRVSVLDIDFDISGLKRQQVLNKFREEYGEDRVCNVATFATEKSKSAILTAARGLEIDTDEAQYIASLIPADRGQTRTLKQCYYGDEENGWVPVASFKRAMDNDYPELWRVAQQIEGLICRMGIHAGGVIFVDEDITESTALMCAPDGTVISQFELHDLEDCSLIKYDALSVVAMDKIQICLELLCDAGYITREKTLRETYEKVIGIYNLERKEPEMWRMIWRHEIESLFQMEQQSGIQGIELTHPQNVDDLATLNSVIRLMAQDKDSEQPLNKYARFKKDIHGWYKEMDAHGLNKEEQELLKGILSISYGICESQERFMMLVQLPECGGLDLNFADQLRKAIAKKNPAAYLKLEQQYYENMEEKQLSKPLCHYVWDVLVATSRGYGFNLSHTLAYSLIALQEMNLAYKYPRIFWDCANLIVNSGGDEENEEEGVNYGKIATAINKMKTTVGTQVSLVDINHSSLTFTPNEEGNEILFGMKALSGINNETYEQIIKGRPYDNIADFMKRCPLNKTQMISLIKSGAFDKLEADWGRELNLHPRFVVMAYYLSKACEPKNKLNLQNFNTLIQRGLVPESLDFERRVFEFNKYLKANTKVGKYFVFDEPCDKFYKDNFDIEKLEIIKGLTCIQQKTWDGIYQKQMDGARDWLKEHQGDVLRELNTQLFMDTWNKYAQGSLSSWEMESLCFYYHEHELANVDTHKYGISNFFALPENPEVEYYFKRNGQQIPIWKTHKIIGTVIAKNDNKASITLLTPSGVVTVKFTKEYYSQYKKQISEINEDGSKSVVEKGWFKRGTMLLLHGYRRGDQFVTKSYKHSNCHQLYKISLINDGRDMELTHERKDMIE